MSDSSISPAGSQDLSVIGRQCIAAICLQRFCAHYGIRHRAIDAFIEQLWGVATTSSDNFPEWAEAFEQLPDWVTGAPTTVPPELFPAVPSAVLSAYSQLANAALECSATTWYGSDMPGTIEEFETVVRIMNTHELPIPPFAPFLISSPHAGDGWGNNPTPDELRAWRAEAD